MAKTLKATAKTSATIKAVNKTVDFKPVGTLVPFKIPNYYYFELIPNTADFKQSGRYLIRHYGGNVDRLKDVIPTKRSYYFRNIKTNKNFNDFVNLYVSGSLSTLINNIKNHVATILPTKVESIVNIVDSAEREKKKQELVQYYSYDFLLEQVANITGDATVQSQVMLYLLNPAELRKIQYEYMLFEDRQEDGGSASQMKEGVKEGYIFGITGPTGNYIDAINRKCQNIIAKNKELLEANKIANQSGTDVIGYINANLTALYEYLGDNALLIARELRTQGNDLGNELNPDDSPQANKGNKNNKNTKTKGIDLTTILLLTLPIVAIILIKKKGK